MADYESGNYYVVDIRTNKPTDLAGPFITFDAAYDEYERIGHAYQEEHPHIVIPTCFAVIFRPDVPPNTSTGRALCKVSFFVGGQPAPEPRQSKRDDFNPSVSVLRYRAWREAIGLVANQAFADMPVIDEISWVELSLVFQMTMPKHWSEKKKAEMYGTIHTNTPDLSNLIKAVEDALTGIAYPDDRVIGGYFGNPRKVWSYPEDTGVIVTVHYMVPGDLVRDLDVDDVRHESGHRE